MTIDLKEKQKLLEGQYFALEEQYSELSQRMESNRVGEIYQ